MNAAIPSDIVQSPLERLKITEIFLSLQGEAATAGWPTVFVRLTAATASSRSSPRWITRPPR